jgi:hypothetical protein
MLNLFLKLKYARTVTWYLGVFMVNILVSLPLNWAEFLESMADEHDIEIGEVIGELCNWAFSRPEFKAQFEAWLDKEYPKSGQVEDGVHIKGEAANACEGQRDTAVKKKPMKTAKKL